MPLLTAKLALQGNLRAIYQRIDFVRLCIGYQRLPEWLGSRVVSVLDSGAEGPGFRSQRRRCRVTSLLGKLCTPIVTAGLAESNDNLPPGL